MKKPVVATSVGGIPELVNNESSYLIEIGNYKEWIDKLSILINDENKRKQMGLIGYEFVKNNFTWDIIVKRFVQIININKFRAQD